ncbi:lipoate--protein ligase family protein [Nocardioides sp.]|uniref:lipoate--protein ligase family protein n=1 Tax=Nocardioides sp. TaxID=35761 RepID=UPI002618EF25|nr:lipoate--protein ligase family protein [Nocardioides sp.]MCW2735522.1 Lipoate-protein ligase [Nocardioides sp.]
MSTSGPSDPWDPVLLGPVVSGESGELAVAHALLRRASEGAIRQAFHLYAPVAPVVVFGRRDTRLPGFADAVRAAEDAGFDTAVRAVGGRVVAYTENALVLDVVRHEPQAVGAMDHRFVTFGELMVEALRTIGVQARLGAVPGEYCPGAHSVNARGVVKLVGTAQRVVKDAWLFSSLVVVDDRARLQDVLADVHRHLDLPFDPASVGTVRGENPAVDLSEVREALSSAWGIDDAAPAVLDGVTRGLAERLEPGQRARTTD